jgi:hypothetical protein
MRYDHFRSKLKKIQSNIPHLLEPDCLSQEREFGLNALLHKEVELYNHLLFHIRENIEDTLSFIDGAKQATTSVEDTFECMQRGQTPFTWLKNSYPASTSLARFVLNLNERV